MEPFVRPQKHATGEKIELVYDYGWGVLDEPEGIVISLDLT